MILIIIMNEENAFETNQRKVMLICWSETINNKVSWRQVNKFTPICEWREPTSQSISGPCRLLEIIYHYWFINPMMINN